MRLLIDAHALIWYVDQDHLLSPTAHAAITDPANDLRYRPRQRPAAQCRADLGDRHQSRDQEAYAIPALPTMDRSSRRRPEPATLADYHRSRRIQSSLPLHRRDPFDRLLVAQALVEQLPVISGDLQVDAYGIHRVW